MITYDVDIKPILEIHCNMCHNWNYINAFNKRFEIKDKVSIIKTMPPDGLLTDQDRELIRIWVDSGAEK